ncbi:hypothetical protein ACLKA6_004276 [Drosophila palustris]
MDRKTNATRCPQLLAFGLVPRLRSRLRSVFELDSIPDLFASSRCKTSQSMVRCGVQSMYDTSFTPNDDYDDDDDDCNMARLVSYVDGQVESTTANEAEQSPLTYTDCDPAAVAHLWHH